MSKHVVCLKGKNGANLDPSHGPLLRELLDLFVDGCQQATRLRIEGRSTAPGNLPAWLERAASFDVAVRPGQVVLASRSFAEAVPERFRQLDLFEDLDPSRSCLDLFEDSVEDALAGRADSDRYDQPLMATLEGFGRLFRHGVDHMDLQNGRTLRVDPGSVDTIRTLRKRTPEDRRAMVAGKLETIRHSDRAFALVLESGELIRGVVATDQIASADLAALFGRQTLVGGYVKFRPSGSLLRIEAERMQPASPTDKEVFASAPTPLFVDLDPRDLRKHQGPRSGLATIVGQWPGEESDEEVQRALAELS